MPSLSYKEALDVALCYGWIDGQKRPESERTRRCGPPGGATVPSDFQAALDANQRAAAFFKTLDRANRYAVLWRIQTVKKAETRARKIQQFIEMLKREEKIHP